MQTPSAAEIHRTIREYNTKRPSTPASVVINGENGQAVDAKSGRPVRSTHPLHIQSRATTVNIDAVQLRRRRPTGHTSGRSCWPGTRSSQRKTKSWRLGWAVSHTTRRSSRRRSSCRRTRSSTCGSSWPASSRPGSVPRKTTTSCASGPRRASREAASAVAAAAAAAKPRTCRPPPLRLQRRRR